MYNKDELNYRIALQVERDVRDQDLGVIAADLAESIEKRKQAKISPLVGTDDVASIKKYTLSLAHAHLELKFGTLWTNLSEAAQDKVVSEATNKIVDAIPKSYPNTEIDIMALGPFYLEESFNMLNSQPNQPTKAKNA